MKGKMEMSIVRLCCSSCHKEVRPNEEVTLDIINTITHKSCNPTNLPVKDAGTFQEMANKYPSLK
jgi:hypothetical protein